MTGSGNAGGLRLRSGFGSGPKARIPLRINIAILVSILLVFVAGLIMANDQISGREAALSQAREKFRHLGELVRVELRALQTPVETAVEAVAGMVALIADDRVFTAGTARLFAQRIAETTRLGALYYGDRRGNFLIVYNLAADPESGDGAYLAWIIRRPEPGAFRQTVVTFDRDFRAISTDDRQNNGFDPRLRPWFHEALKADRLIATAPYVFYRTSEIGITVVRRTAGAIGVAGGDVTLATLSKTLATRRPSPASQSVLFDQSTAILAAADIGHVLDVRRSGARKRLRQQTLASAGVPVYRALSRLHAAGETQGVHEIVADGRSWVVWLAPLGRDGRLDATIAVMQPSVEVFSDITRLMRFSLIAALAGLALGIVLAWIVANTITRPIHALTEDAYRMRKFDLSERPPVRSRIVEVHRLSQAVQTLRRSLGDFARYVPAQLVQRLLAGDMKAEVGGQRREVTLFFSDIANFTSLSETMDPMDLMRQVSDYFGELGTILVEHGATIDKYIGDAAMAFWNAPVTIDDHPVRACEAALAIDRRLADFNARRVASGLDPFHTRIGLHTGNVVVGNIGSSERIDFTVLGANVNLASRLEGLNKQLGTRILISEAVRTRIGDRFPTRPVGRVRPVGASEPVEVFELLAPGEYAADDESEARHLESWDACYRLFNARDWRGSTAALETHLEFWPADAVAANLLHRAAAYAENPPPADWDGVFEAKAK